ncbi:hypothetical protein BC673_1682 [Prevotella pallens]|uniref:Uncharacterized protein n=1 Tax=Prevotella pallens TaxID=60133 RepID=A0ABX9DML1_9BACT|nr:hypothetical protein BC673_1682 [Prevotella pallens]
MELTRWQISEILSNYTSSSEGFILVREIYAGRKNLKC